MNISRPFSASKTKPFHIEDAPLCHDPTDIFCPAFLSSDSPMPQPQIPVEMQAR